jgi:hypothetical protein
VIKILWTRHAGERQKEWEKKFGITREEVENAVMNPEQIVFGDKDAMVAQVRRVDGLLRVPFVEVGGARKILTMYWTSKVEKYWKEK